jgi:hypothetical protein
MLKRKHNRWKFSCCPTESSQLENWNHLSCRRVVFLSTFTVNTWYVHKNVLILVSPIWNGNTIFDFLIQRERIGFHYTYIVNFDSARFIKIWYVSSPKYQIWRFGGELSLLSVGGYLFWYVGLSKTGDTRMMIMLNEITFRLYHLILLGGLVFPRPWWYPLVSLLWTSRLLWQPLL